MDKAPTRRHRFTGATPPRSPILLHSKSGTETIPSADQLHVLTSKPEQTSLRIRSNSSISNYSFRETVNPSPINTSLNKKGADKRESQLVKLKQQPSSHTKVPGATLIRARSVSNTQSAWALSPGREIPCTITPNGPASLGGSKVKSSSSVSSRVLKYFSQKKVSSVEKEDYHQFRILQNKLLQWRFVNARAESSIDVVDIVAQNKSVNVCIRMFELRNSIKEKRIKMQRLVHEIKVDDIINPQLMLLHEWTKLERKNNVAVGRLVRKLSAVSVRLPLHKGAKADVESVYDSMTMALGVMKNIEAAISNYLTVVEMLQELFNIVKQEEECMEELREWITFIVPLEAKERSLQVCLMQASS